MLTESQIVGFVQRGYLVVQQVVPEDLLEKAVQRVGQITADDPPAADKRGAHFHFLEAKSEPDLLATLTDSPAFDLAEELAGPGSLDVPWQVQVALNIPPYAHRPGRPHIDAANSQATGDPVRGTFTMLAGILMTDQLSENSGNLWVWPGTHLTHAAYFREHGPQMFCAYPPVDLPQPTQLTGRAGDLLLAHYLLGHNIGGNYETNETRRALYFRLSNTEHLSRQDEFLQNVWLEYEPLHSLAVDATG